MLKADGLDEAILGVTRVNEREVLAYSVSKIIEILMTRDGMTREMAYEFFDFNIAGAYLDPGMPIYIFEWNEEETETN